MNTNTKKKAPTFNPLRTPEAQAAKKKPAGKSKKTPSQKSANPSPAKVDLTDVKPPFSVYYDDRKGRYYYEEGAGRWCGYGLDDFRRRLRAHGVSGRTEEGTLTSPQDNVILKVQDDFGIDYAGPLAGHFAGFQAVNGSRILVTTSPKLSQPSEGKFPHLNEFLDGIFGVGEDPHGKTQRLVFDLWLGRAWHGIAENRTLLGHALILAGPAGSGKNLLQELIIHTALGGRSVKAGPYMLGATDFNGDLFGGEHLIMSDENGGRDFRSRRELGQKIKAIVANRLHPLHAKGRDALTVAVKWRFTVSVNDEAEHLQTLPPVADADIRDKVHLLRVWPAMLPHDEDAATAWTGKLVEEIPAYLAHCLSLEVPKNLRETRQRFGHRAFQHPELLERLNAFSPELHLLELIDQLLFPSGDSLPDKCEPWEGRASDLRAKLLEAASGRISLEREISDLLKSAEQCGQYLARLRDHYPNRIEEIQRKGNKRGWRIHPPSKESDG